jgi:HPt (histidine-containing phosphotransfer) domain-containing protein
MSADSRAEKLRRIRERFLGELGSMVAALAEACRAGAASDARLRAHTLAGTAGTFGLAGVSAEARALEDLLADPAALGSPRLAALLAGLEAAADRARSTPH